MKLCFIECDGSRKEAHEDTVWIVGGRVLFDRCREKISVGFELENEDIAGRSSC